MVRKLQTHDEFQAEYFREHPEEIAPHIEEAFDEYAQDGDTAALLSALRTIAQVKGITKIADQIGMTRQGLQKALSAAGNPRLENINAIVHALGYRLTVKQVEATLG